MDEHWNNVLEQNKAKEILNSIYKSKLIPHAFIFAGPVGIGKYNVALQYAKILYSFCDNDIKNNAVKKISNLQEPYIKLIFPLPRGKGESAEDTAIDKLSNDQLEIIQEQIQKKIINPYHKIYVEDSFTIKINSVRDIKKYISVSYNDIPLRFIMILDADLMNEQAQNALLKSIEEPPEGIIFFLIITNKDKLLPTIRSRCWSLDFEPLCKDSIKKILIEHFNVDHQLAEKVSYFSEGSLHVANDLLERNIDELLKTIITILRFSLAKRYYSANKELSSVYVKRSSEELKTIIRFVKIWLNDVIRNRHSAFDYYFDSFQDTLEKFNQKYVDANVEELFQKLDQLEEYSNKNLNLNVLTLNLIFEIASMSIRN